MPPSRPYKHRVEKEQQATTHELNFKAFKALVKIDGVQTRCYGVTTDKRAKTVSCWIASEAGMKFSVLLKKTETKYFSVCRLYTDGLQMGGRRLTEKGKDDHCMAHLVTSKSTRRPFIFQNLSTIDDVAVIDSSLFSSNSGREADIGEIKLVIWRSTGAVRMRTDEVKTGTQEAETGTAALPNICQVLESSQKAGNCSHQVAFGENVNYVLGQRKKGDLKRFEEIRETVAVFIFRYRPIETLIRLDICPPLLIDAHVRLSEVQRALQHTIGEETPAPVIALTAVAAHVARVTSPLPSNALVHDQTGAPITVSAPAIKPAPKSQIVTLPELERRSSPVLEDKKPELELICTAAEHAILSREESRLLLKLETIRDRKREMEVKQENDTNKRIKMECPDKHQYFLPGELIDLTSD